MTLSEETVHVLRDLNPWWDAAPTIRPQPPPYRRPTIQAITERMAKPQGLIEVLRGPRQVGKSTGLLQTIEDLIAKGVRGRDLLYIRFDLDILRHEAQALRRMLRWYFERVRERPIAEGAPSRLFLDEIHKLPRWNDEVKHIGDTFPVRMLLTGSSSVRVARGSRESLAGRTFTSELPTFSFREVLECWHPDVSDVLPPRLGMDGWFDIHAASRNPAQWDDSSLTRALGAHRIDRIQERYFQRGGYPRMHNGEVADDQWADYLTEFVLDAVLGKDIPDLFPVDNPTLLRQLYVQVARHTATEIAQNKLAQLLTAMEIPTTQPTVGKYLKYLADALLIREFRRYPMTRKPSARVQAKITVSDLGIRNALFRGAPSLSESDPGVLGPLVETLVQTALRGQNFQFHFYRDNENPRDRHSPLVEVDFVVERPDGGVLPIEVKYRQRIDTEDFRGLDHFLQRFEASFGIMITRNLSRWDPKRRILSLPLHHFLLSV